MIQLPRFFCSLADPAQASILVLGIPYDCTSSFRPGSRFAAREMRIISEEAIEDFSFDLGQSLEQVLFCDLGDLPLMVGNPHLMVDQVRKEIAPLLKQNKRIVALGGEHLITYPVFLEMFDQNLNFSILHLDAHADLRDSYGNDELSHASVFNLCLKKGLKKLIQYGIRSGTQAEYLKRINDSRIFPCSEMQDLEDSIEDGETIYLSLDFDFFDPGFLPGTGTPEAGGASYRDFIQILKILARKKINLLGADLVELAPNLDPSGNSAIFGAKLLRDLLIFMQKH